MHRLINFTMKITVLGTWYVWLIQAVGLAKIGYKVTAIDVVEEKIRLLNQGIPTIYENWLEELLREVQGNIEFTTDKNTTKDADIIFLCVPTPQDEDGKTDLGYIRSACESLKPILSGKEIIVIKSTVPTGTNDMVYDFLGKRNPVVSNPEFLREWLAIYDFFHPSRVLLGFREHEDESVKEKVREVYSYFSRENIPLLEMSSSTAELTKYAANAFLATKITFMNEMAHLADASGADIRMITTALGLDPRIGAKSLYPGLGYGWSCFPKDVKSLIHQFQQYGLRSQIVENVDAVNNSQVEYFLSKILKHYDGDIHGKTFAVSGLAFKPDTDDLRESKGIELIKILLDQWANLRVFDYNAKARENFEKLSYSLSLSNRSFISLVLCDSFEDILAWAEALVVTLEDPRIQSESITKNSVKDHVVFDGRNILDKEYLQSIGYTYFGIGC